MFLLRNLVNCEFYLYHYVPVVLLDIVLGLILVRLFPCSLTTAQQHLNLMKSCASTVCRYICHHCFTRNLPASLHVFFISFNLLLNHIFWQALESFLLRCPRDISPYCHDILNLTLEFLSYDPNFTDSMDEDTDDEGNVDDEEEYVIE